MLLVLVFCESNCCKSVVGCRRRFPTRVIPNFCATLKMYPKPIAEKYPGNLTYHSLQSIELYDVIYAAFISFSKRTVTTKLKAKDNFL